MRKKKSFLMSASNSSWLKTWKGLPYEPRFMIVNNKSEDNADKKTTSIIRAGKRDLWFTETWQPIFPYSLNKELSNYFEGQKEAIYMDPMTYPEENFESEEKFLAFLDDIAPPFLYGKVYLDTFLPELKAKLNDSEKATSIKQGTVTYKFSGLLNVQKDFISEFFEFLRSYILDEQNDKLKETGCLSYDPRTDEYPLPTNDFINVHVTTLILEICDDDYYLTIGYDYYNDENELNGKPICPEFLEITLTVDMEPDYIVNPDEESVITYEEGDPLIIFSLLMDKV